MSIINEDCKKIGIRNLIIYLTMIVVGICIVLHFATMITRFIEMDTGVSNTTTTTTTTTTTKNDQELEIVPDNYTGVILLESTIESEADVYMDNLMTKLTYDTGEIVKVDGKKSISTNESTSYARHLWIFRGRVVMLIILLIGVMIVKTIRI